MTFRFSKPIAETALSHIEVEKKIQDVTDMRGVDTVLKHAKNFPTRSVEQIANKLEIAVGRICFTGNRETAINIIRDTRKKIISQKQ
jgi:uncharacterized linocin/CFP29 family protein